MAETTQRILSFDLGKSFGWAYKDVIGEEYGHGTYIELTDWGDQVKELLDQWKPNVVVLAQTNNYANRNYFSTMRKHLMMAGIVFYICGKKGIVGVEMTDVQARKLALGKGYKKKEVQKMFPEYQPDALDALILARGWFILNSETE
jgi:Holliday junction resolvasome RuvABC endonuclease subunit